MPKAIVAGGGRWRGSWICLHAVCHADNAARAAEQARRRGKPRRPDDAGLPVINFANIAVVKTTHRAFESCRRIISLSDFRKW